MSEETVFVKNNRPETFLEEVVFEGPIVVSDFRPDLEAPSTISLAEEETYIIPLRDMEGEIIAYLKAFVVS